MLTYGREHQESLTRLYLIIPKQEFQKEATLLTGDLSLEVLEEMVKQAGLQKEGMWSRDNLERMLKLMEIPELPITFLEMQEVSAAEPAVTEEELEAAIDALEEEARVLRAEPYSSPLYQK